MAKTSKPADKPIPAKTCYNHLGGKLGALLLEQFIGNGWISKNDHAEPHYFVTEKGKKEFKKLGVDLSLIQ